MKPAQPHQIQADYDNVMCGPTRHYSTTEAGISDQIFDFFTKLLDTSDWPPRWYCGNWTDFHGWLYILSDIGIWAAYFAIPILLLTLLQKRSDIPFHKIFFLFVAFILLCGLTHLMDAVVFWWPAYRLSALLRLATAIVSIFSVYVLYKTLPLIFNLRSVTDLEAEIEKRKAVEEKLAASEFLLSEASRISRVGGWETNLIKNKRTWSKTILDILELPENYAIENIDVLSYFQEPHRRQLRDAITNCFSFNQKWDLELLLTSGKGNKIWVRSTGEPLFDENGKQIKVRGILMDIERYKATEVALTESLELTTRSNQQLKNFTHILSHDIRNHASNLLTISSLVDSGQLNEENAEMFEQIKNISVGLNSTLEDLSKAIRIKESVVCKEILNFEDITRKVIVILENEIKSHQVEIKFYFDVGQVYFPKIYLESIFLNLISNAIKYRNDAVLPLITLKTYRDSNHRTVLECTDNGIGIDLDLHGKKIFGLYKTFHDRDDAHGVGLFLVKTQIESQAGNIEVFSSPGNGSTFKITFNEQT